MATPDEIERRVEEADTARSAQRSVAARQVGELAQRRAAIAEQLEDVERELGDALAATDDVIGVDELARFTDIPAADLTRWLSVRKTPRAKRKKAAAGTPSTTNAGRPASARPTPARVSPVPDLAATSLDTTTSAGSTEDGTRP